MKNSLGDIAKRVDDLVSGKIEDIPADYAMGRFHDAIRSYDCHVRQRKETAPLAEERRRKAILAIIDDERLRDREAGPPEDGYVWEDLVYVRYEHKGEGHTKLARGWMPPRETEDPPPLAEECTKLAACHDWYYRTELHVKRPLIFTRELLDEVPELEAYYCGGDSVDHVHLMLTFEKGDEYAQEYLNFAFGDVLADFKSDLASPVDGNSKPGTVGVTSQPPGSAKKKGSRGPERLGLQEAKERLEILKKWATQQKLNDEVLPEDRVSLAGFAERHGMTWDEIRRVQAWYRGGVKKTWWPDDPRTVSQEDLEKLFA